MSVYIVDTETTGVKPPYFEVIELAQIKIDFHSLNEAASLAAQSAPAHQLFEHLTHIKCNLFCPKGDIHPEATKVNGFTKSDLLEMPCVSTLKLESMDYMIGHNVNFDWRVLGKPDIKQICTMKLAQSLIKDTPNYKLGTLICKLYPNEGKSLIDSSHTAVHDCKLTFLLLANLVANMKKFESFDYLYNLQASSTSNSDGIRPFKFKEVENEWYILFGKYKGSTLKVLPKSYLEYLYNADFQPAEKELIRKFF